MCTLRICKRETPSAQTNVISIILLPAINDVHRFSTNFPPANKYLTITKTATAYLTRHGNVTRQLQLAAGFGFLRDRIKWRTAFAAGWTSGQGQDRAINWCTRYLSPARMIDIRPLMNSVSPIGGVKPDTAREFHWCFTAGKRDLEKCEKTRYGTTEIG
ncbi:uncharacterized protein BJ212DRAFT_1297777 [Suillus subaureus]|uniref:Uncharacterized protein n=1 Tax=Suillus subaureus TaxID=48587 RepID=A0A9P7EG42_9AGAM|nr:uncharacterized protein BJ212DRAFT_1297777 [Suillus subaureus]KAG1820358.1 hypothetical protein BJ212DRAFT_1297777 [Suillus subaureus]